MATIFKRGTKLYLEFFDITKNKKRQKSTGLEDTPKNREYLRSNIIPTLEQEVKKKPKAIEYLYLYITHYLKTKENLSTYIEIESKTNKILEYFGNVDITTIKPLECKNYILNLKVSTKTKRNHLNVLRGIFDTACENQIILENPTQYIKLIKTQEELSKDDIEPFSKYEVDILLKNADGILKEYLALAFYTGARSGELLALTIDDIDFINKTISISKQYTKGILKYNLKTQKSKRVIPLFNQCNIYLESLIARAKANDSIYLFSKIGKPKDLFSIDNIRGKKGQGVWSKLLVKCNIEYRKIYQTRHTFIVNMLNSGFFRVTDLAQIVGHSNTQMIMTVYAKYIKGEQLQIDRDIDIFASTDS